MAGDIRLANQAWEAYYRAQATIALELTNADIWDGLLTREYAVLHALSREPHGLRITELGQDVLLTQPGMSRLIIRLETRGLVERSDDAADARARRIRLTPEGVSAQRRVGANVARHVAEAMTRALDSEQMTTLRDLSNTLAAGATGHEPSARKQSIERNDS
ncbi:MarR family winged helix-turn-helix transcriptional regulator [Glaciibacter superstes]|uniref:MarR family winged helix-turn-helix transcriptional regulator n=1 Tax=Glaciibacter superstes TaxID=501023 RepID=UPI0003B5AABF|nr:MarR family winged helix-turn-helix transcriptional regulator [Glaciibacter superstes]